MAESTRTIELPSGARLTVTIDASLFDLDRADRDLVFAIVDQAKRFVHEISRMAQVPPIWCAVCRATEDCHMPGGSRYPADHLFVPAAPSDDRRGGSGAVSAPTGASVDSHTPTPPPVDAGHQDQEP